MLRRCTLRLLVSAVLVTCPAPATQATQSSCTDTSKDCKFWASKHECVANPFYMRAVCRQACKACGDSSNNQQPRLHGFATEQGTKLYATMLPSVSRHASSGHFRKDTSMGSYWVPGQIVRSTPWLMLSSFGTGTYLGASDDTTDEAVTASIIKAVYHGLNVIDTACNYRDGRAERAVGRALHVLMELPGFSREMLFVSTKAGFADTQILQRLLLSGKIDALDLEGGIHCIAPACLQASLENSLAALSLKTVDLLYLHNVAEMSLTLSGQDPRLYDRLARAFKWLEEARAQGLIRAYGMATWTCFRVNSKDRSFLSLQRLVQLAESIGGKDHGFRYVQLPINADMLEAVLQRWQPLKVGSKTRHVTLLEAAAELGVGVFASGPLGEGSLAKDASVKARVESVQSLKSLPSVQTKLLQLVRSTPFLLSAVVGHKTKLHVEENLKLVSTKPLSKEAFERAMRAFDV